MAIRDATYVALLLIPYVAGIASTVYDHTEYATYGLADVAHAYRFQSAIRSNSLQWYQDGMQLFAYGYNGHEWKKRTLTWAIGQASKRPGTGSMWDAAQRAFKQWSTVTPFWFRQVSLSDKPDITFSFEKFDGRKVNMHCDVKFPKEKYLDDDGATLIVNDVWSWNNVPYNEGVKNLNYAVLYLVSWCLGLGPSTDANAVMSTKNPQFDLIYANYDLHRDDIIGIQRLYGFPELQDGGPDIPRPFPVMPEPSTPESGSSSRGNASWSSNPTPPETPSSTPLRVRPLSWKPPRPPQ